MGESPGLLFELDALDLGGSATETGRKMASFPLHPRLAHLLMHAQELKVPRLGADLAAILSERDILRRTVRSCGYVRAGHYRASAGV